jgi:hypothetical protein
MRNCLPLLALITLFLLPGCGKENMGDCVKSTGKVMQQNRSVAAFDKLEVEDNINVFITFGDENELVAEAGENLLPLIITEVKDNTLIIRNDNKCNWVRSFEVPVNVYLKSTGLQSITSRGFGLIETLDTLVTDVFTAEHWLASGKIKLRIDAQEVYLKSHTGVGDFDCIGKAGYLYLYSSSHGIFRTENLVADNCYALNFGTGDFHVNVSDTLIVSLSSLGNIYYNSGVTIITEQISGSGTTIPY